MNNILRSASSSGGTDSASRAAKPRPSGTAADPETAETAGAADAYHRARLYSLLSLALDRPGEEFVAVAEEGLFVDHLQESARALGDEQLPRAVDRVLEEFDHPEGHRHEWASLFGVEEGVTVSPYQLTYLPGPLMTTIRELADMKGFYRAFDLTIAADERDRGDHVVFQTEFLGHLSLREGVLREEDDQEGIGVVVDARRRFLEDHLGRWYWRFAEEVSKHDDGFYAALVELLAILVEREIDRRDLDPQWVPDDPEVTEWNEGVFGESGRDCGGCGTTGGPDDGRAADPKLLDEFGPPREDELPDPEEYGPLSDE